MLSGDSSDFCINVSHVDLNVFCLSDSVQNDVGLYVFFSGRTLVVTDLFVGQTGVLLVHIHVHLAAFQAHAHFFNHLADAVFNHDGRNGEFSVSYSSVNQSMLVSNLGVFFSSLLHTLLVVSAHFFYGLEFAISSNVLIGQLGQLFNLNVLNVNLKYCFLASQLFNEVFFGEGYFYVSSIALGQANQLVFEARNEGVGANLQRIALAFAAAEGFAANCTSKVDNSEVTLFNDVAFFSCYHLSVAVTQVVHLSLNILVGYDGLFLVNMQALVFAQLGFRFNGNLNGQFHVLAFFENGLFNLGILNGNQVLNVQSFGVQFICDHFESFLFDSFLAIVHLNDTTRSLALTEARNIYAISNFLYSFFEAGIYISSRSGNL